MCDELWYVRTPEAVQEKACSGKAGNIRMSGSKGLCGVGSQKRSFLKACDRVIEDGEDFKETCIQIQKALESY